METQLEKQIEKIVPEDIARTLESAYHVVVQGNHEHIDDLLRHGGTLLRKAAQRFTSTQLILGLAAIAAVAVVVVNRAANQEDDDRHDDVTEGEAHDVTKRAPKPKPAPAPAQ